MKVKDAMKGWAITKKHLFVISINVYLIRYQLKSNSNNFGKCLENMIIKQEQEHSVTRRQHFVVIFRRYLLSTVPWKTIKWEQKTRLLYSDRWLLLSVNKRCKNDRRLFENVDTETMLLLPEVASSSLWPSLSPRFLILCLTFSLGLTNRRPCLRFVPEKSISEQAILDTVIFDFQSKRNRCTYSKITHLQSLCWTFDIDVLVTFCLVTQVTQNTSRARWTIPIPLCALGWANQDCFPQYNIYQFTY